MNTLDLMTVSDEDLAYEISKRKSIKDKEQYIITQRAVKILHLLRSAELISKYYDFDRAFSRKDENIVVIKLYYNKDYMSKESIFNMPLDIFLDDELLNKWLEPKMAAIKSRKAKEEYTKAKEELDKIKSKYPDVTFEE
jgi:hypothetical protein